MIQSHNSRFLFAGHDLVRTRRIWNKNTSWSFPHSWLIIEFTPVFIGARVSRSLDLCVCFVDRCLSFYPFFFWPLCCLFFFDIRILITPLVSSNSSYYVHSKIRKPYNLNVFGSKKTKGSKQAISAKVTYARWRLMTFFVSYFTILHKRTCTWWGYSIQRYVIIKRKYQM
jgi:hypothetical protein